MNRAIAAITSACAMALTLLGAPRVATHGTANMVVHQDGNHHRGGAVRSDARSTQQREHHDAGTGDGGNGTIHDLRDLRASAEVGEIHRHTLH